MTDEATPGSRPEQGQEARLLAERRRERRLAQERTRKRKARQQQSPEQQERERNKRKTPERLSRERERKRIARQQASPEQRLREKERDRKRCRSGRLQKVRSFMTVDSEGGGTDHLGRQHSLLIAAAGPDGEEYVKHRDSNPLSVRDFLEFILSLPPEPILVSFYFGYDANQIIRGMRIETWKRILNPPQGRNGAMSTYWGEYAVTYQQGQYFRVSRVDRSGPKPRTDKASTRTVYDAFGFFQCSFNDAIKNWNVGNEEERAFIARNKADRGQFSCLTDEMIKYCTLECRLFAMLMSEFRAVCTAAGILPKQWSGAGWIAAALLEKYGIPKRPLTAKETAAQAARQPGKNPNATALRRPARNPEFEVAVNHAYYGGHFEVRRFGFIRSPTGGPVYEYDKNSAYAAGMPQLPCPLHTRWEHRPYARHLPKAGLYLAKVMFEHPSGTPWCGLPFRHNGGLFWPFHGVGWYWSPEIEAAHRCLGADISVLDLWVARRTCNCRFYDWVPEVYDERRRLGASTRGYPLKVGLSSLYGKKAQRTGRGPYHDAVDAGLVTAMTRASLMEAVGHDPEAVVMLATDAVFSTRPLPLDIGTGLGQWERKTWPDLFIAQPGVYWSPTEVAASAGQSPASLKSRGAPRSVIGPAVPAFHQAFSKWMEKLSQPGAIAEMLDSRKELIPSVPVELDVFYGCRLALAMGKPWLAGSWRKETQKISFEWRSKRDPMHMQIDDDRLSFTTRPILLHSPYAESEGYKPVDFDRVINIAADDGGVQSINESVLLEGQPDFMPWLPRD